MVNIRRKTKSTSEMSMASMSDIAFLLIIFFTISSVFIANAGMELILPDKNKQPVAVNSSNVIKISVYNDSRITIDSKNIQKSKLIEHLHKIKNDKEQFILLRIQGEVPYKSAVNIIDSIDRSDFKKLSIKLLKGHEN